MSDHSYGQVTMTAQQYAELAQKAAAHDATEAQAAQSDTPTDTPLEDGEGEMSEERRLLMQGAERPGEQAPPHPHDEAERVYKAALEDGAPWRVAVGGAINSLVNAAHRGDQRVILDKTGLTPPDQRPNW